MEKPINLKTWEVQAILDGRKTQIRRAIKPKYSNTNIEWFTDKRGTRLIEMQNDTPPDTYNPETKTTTMHVKACVEVKQPYQVGNILWVRETWAETWTPCDNTGFVYKADGKPDIFPYWGHVTKKCICKDKVWRPSIHMPRRAARIFLHVAGVKVERLQDISEEDAMSEGVKKYTKDGVVCKYAVNEEQFEWKNMPKNPIESLKQIWDSTTKKQDMHIYGWDANPWVWVVEFERVMEV